ncbi:MAG: calcium/sodium antiporter [Desulfobacterales bacterium]
MEPYPLLAFAAGLGLLALGAMLLVGAASRIAAGWGISPLVVGLTVVAWGTSAPEFAVSVLAAAAGNADIALANVIGSNLFNVLFVLGACAAISPLLVEVRLVRREAPLLFLLSAAFWLLALDGRISRLEGAALAAGMTLYTAWTIRLARREVGEGDRGEAAVPPPSPVRPSLSRLGFLLLQGAAGVFLLAAGARTLVSAATAIARGLGVSDAVIGLTLVAAGTSLPEAFTSLAALLRGERSIAVGNALGSNLFNLLGIAGPAALVSPQGLSVSGALLSFDLPLMVSAAAACLPVFFTGFRIARWEGVLFLATYGAYLAFAMLDAAGHDALPPFSGALLAFALPLIATTGAGITRRWLARKETDPPPPAPPESVCRQGDGRGEMINSGEGGPRV